MDWKGEPAESTGACESVDEGWGTVEFREVELGDKRLEQRLKILAEALSTRPQAPINQASEDWAATKAAYRCFANPKASEGIVKLMAHGLTVPQYIVIMTSSEYFILYSSHLVID